MVILELNISFNEDYRNMETEASGDLIGDLNPLVRKNFYAYIIIHIKLHLILKCIKGSNYAKKKGFEFLSMNCIKNCMPRPDISLSKK